MSEEFDLRSSIYWRRIGLGLVAGVLSALGAFAFMGLMRLGQAVVIPDLSSWAPFSGSWTMIVIMTVVGLIVGLIHRYTSAAQGDVFVAIDEGEMDPKPVPASLLVSLLSLIGGFALGPEVPSGMLAAGLSTWISKRRKLDEKTTRTNVLSGVSAAYAGLFSSPFAMLLILLESAHVQSILYYGTLLIAGLASFIGFGLFYYLGGNTFSPLLGLLSPPVYDVKLWYLGVAILLGILGVPVGLLLPVLTKILGRLVAPLKNHPVMRSTLGGFLLGLLAFALPITIGLGTTEIGTVTQNAAEIGVGLLIVFAVAKLLALSSALSFGFIGGPIFPLLFVGSTVGSAVLLLFPQLPQGLVLGCMIVAVPASVVPIPLALVVIGSVIIGLPPTNIAPVLLSAITAFSIVRGLVLRENSESQ